VRGTIRSDADDVYIPMGAGGPTVYGDAWINQVNATQVGLVRAAGGTTDSANYDSTSFNRGWLVIEYVD